jgi:hypothetical protein
LIESNFAPFFLSQNGGEFIFGPGNKADYAYRMQNTEDHSEIADVAKAAGLDIAH